MPALFAICLHVLFASTYDTKFFLPFIHIPCVTYHAPHVSMGLCEVCFRLGVCLLFIPSSRDRYIVGQRRCDIQTVVVQSIPVYICLYFVFSSLEIEIHHSFCFLGCSRSLFPSQEAGHRTKTISECLVHSHQDDPTVLVTPSCLPRCCYISVLGGAFVYCSIFGSDYASSTLSLFLFFVRFWFFSNTRAICLCRAHHVDLCTYMPCASYCSTLS